MKKSTGESYSVRTKESKGILCEEKKYVCTLYGERFVIWRKVLGYLTVTPAGHYTAFKYIDYNAKLC